MTLPTLFLSPVTIPQENPPVIGAKNLDCRKPPHLRCGELKSSGQIHKFPIKHLNQQVDRLYIDFNRVCSQVMSPQTLQS